MRHSKHFIAASLAGLAAAALATGALAQTVADVDADNHQRGCVETDKLMGDKFIVVDGYRYGGCLPKGAENNLDAVRLLIKAANGLGQLRDNRYGGGAVRYLVLGDTTPKMRIVGAGTWMGQPADVRLEWDYRVPGVRFFVTHADKSQDIWVTADPRKPVTGGTGHLDQPELFGKGPVDGVVEVTWKEKPLGVYAGASDMSSQELLSRWPI